MVRSFHERGAAEAIWQVDARASLQQLPYHLQLAEGCGGVQQAEGLGPTFFTLQAQHSRLEQQQV